MHELINNFDFNGHGVRVIRNTNDQVFFVAKDVCDVLNYSNSRDAIAKHCKKEGVAICDTPTESGIQQMTIINEGNLYRLVLKSKKKEAEKFESWVCDEVLPTIRKTGKFETKAPVPISIEDALIQQLLVTKAIRIEQEQIKERLLLIEAKTATRPEYFTVMGYAILNGVKVGLSLAAQLGKKAKTICVSKGYNVDKIHDPRFGRVGSYPSEVLKEVFNTTSFT